MKINKNKLECEMVRQNVGYNELGKLVGLSAAETLGFINAVACGQELSVENVHNVCKALNVDPELILQT